MLKRKETSKHQDNCYVENNFGYVIDNYITSSVYVKELIVYFLLFSENMF